MLYQQPQSGPIRLDANNPYTRGIDVAFVRLDQPGIVGPAQLAKVGSPSLVATKYGQGWFLGNTTSDAFNTSAWPVLADGTEYTYLVVTQLTAIGTTDFLVNGDGASQAFQFRIETSGAPGFISFDTTGTPYFSVGTAMSVGQVQTIVARSATTAISIFQNGIQTANAAVAGTIKGQAASYIQIANRLGLNLHGSIGLLIRWPRALSDAEAKAVTANPWQLIEDGEEDEALMFAAAGGTNTPINPGVGTLALTGYSPVVAQSANQSLTPGAGSIAISGYAPTIAQPKNIAAGVGVLTLAGYAPSIAQSANQSASPAIGSLAISGYAPAISQPQTVAAGAGSFVLTGYAPAITQGITTSIAPVAGSLALTGYAPTVARTLNQAVSPATGTVSIAGYAPAITQPQAVAAGVGSMVIAGYAPSITQGLTTAIVPAAGVVLLSGYPPSVVQTLNQSVAPSSGVMAVTGYPPALAQSQNVAVAPSSGPIIISGFAPSIAQAPSSVGIAPSVGMLLMAGYAPLVVQSGLQPNPHNTYIGQARIRLYTGQKRVRQL
jgi:hypothetical protein